MIIERSWNSYKRALDISYIDSNGQRKMWSKQYEFIKTYKYDDDGTLHTWNGKKCRVSYEKSDKYRPNEFDMLEMIFELDDKNFVNELHRPYTPKVYTYDIETEISDEFPDPEFAKQKVTSISLVGTDMSCMVLGLHKLDDEQQERLKTRYLDFIANNKYANSLREKNEGEIQVIYKYFSSEEQLLKYWFVKIIPNIAVLAGWNSYRFDRLYLVNRLKLLFGEKDALRMIRYASPTKSLSKIRWQEISGEKFSCPIPAHMAELDYMELIKKYEYAFRPYESYSLDWCGSHIVGANKIKYEGTLQDLYERDYEWYYFYNAIDSLIVQLIHQRTKCVKSPCATGSLTLVGLLDAMGQISMTTANLFKVFYDNDQHVVYDWYGISRDKVSFEGAFCNAVPGLWGWTACFDFKSLYPTQIRTCNFSFENFYQNVIGQDAFGRDVVLPWSKKELDEFERDKNYFVSNQGHVYKNDRDYAFKIMQENNTKGRDKYKYLGQKIDAQILTTIDNFIADYNGEKSIENWDDDVKQLFIEQYPNVDIINLSLDELKNLRDSVEALREEYTLIEVSGYKVLSNAAYGASGNPNFYFFNANVAGDITGECRELTKYFWKNLEIFFHETIWKRKDLWEKFDFELDESKHNKCRDSHISVYSDTDSVYISFEPFFESLSDDCYNTKFDTDEKKLLFIENFSRNFLDIQNTEWCEGLYNHRGGHSYHNFELEAIQITQLVYKKKKYIKGVLWSKGKTYAKPKISATGIEIVKSTTPALCRDILTELTKDLMFECKKFKTKYEYVGHFNELLSKKRTEFINAPIIEISQSVGIGDYKKYVIDDTDNLIFAPKCPVSVKAIARYNYLAHKNNQDNLRTISGKIKYYCVRDSYNPRKKDDINYFGYPAGELPSWADKIDLETQWDKNVIIPINRFLSVMGIQEANPIYGVQQSLGSIFDDF